MSDYDKVYQWMEENADDYCDETESDMETAEYMVMDANGECGTNLSEETLWEIAKRILIL